MPVLDRLLDGFPFPTPRPMQVAALGVMAESLESNSRYTAVEGPTGSGKSGLAISLAQVAAARGADEEYKAGAYILTSQKSLAAQLLGDFSPLGLVELKGRSNYPCQAHETTCDEGTIQNRRDAVAERAAETYGITGEPRPTRRCPSCPYAAAKEAFIRSPLAVTSYAYFITEAAHVRQLPPRHALVLDEAHNIDREVISTCCASSSVPPRSA
jgi:Rad3-related DNA helicase